MNVSSFFRNTLSVASLSFLATAALHAQTVATVPVGAITYTIAAGTGTTRVLTPLGFSLLDPASSQGLMTGTITAVGATTLTNTNAGWSPSALSTSIIPYVIQITSGAAQGRIFLVSTATANTANTVTIDAEEASLVNLISAGIVAGDSYRLFSCDTIGSLFGSLGSSGSVLGGTTPTSSDLILLFVSGSYRQYYYNTTQQKWLRAGLNTDATNVAIRPDSAIQYFRLGNTALTLTLTGEVASINRRILVRNSGISPTSTAWPIDITLGSSGINSLPGWTSSTNAAAADLVFLFISGSWRQYYYDGTNWRRAGLATISDSVAISSGTSYIISKKGSTTGANVVYNSIPYSL